MEMIEVDLAIVGAGTAGLYALSEAKRKGLSWVLIEQGVGGTTCARVGCMPSKVLLHTAHLLRQSRLLAQMGFEDSQPSSFDSSQFMSYLRSQRDMFVGGVLSHSLDRMSPPSLLRGCARFTGPNSLVVGEEYSVKATNVLLATGSSPIVPAPWRALGDKVITTDEFFELERLPDSIAVIGLGAIGLELGQGMSALGTRVCGYDASPVLPVAEAEDLQQEIKELLQQQFPLYLGAEVKLHDSEEGVVVEAAGKVATFEKVLVAIGRRPNLSNLNLEAAGVSLNDRGQVEVEPLTQRIPGTHIYLAGDVTGKRTVMHEAGLEALMAVSSIESDNHQRRKTPLAIIFTEPNIARVGTPLNELDTESVVSHHQSLKTNGRAKVKHASEGSILLYADSQTGKLLGAELFCNSAEHLAHTLAWMIEMGASVVDLAKMPTYHPVIEEALMQTIEGLASKIMGRGSMAALKL